MIGILLVILIIVAIVAISRSGKKNKAETEKIETEMQNLKTQTPKQETSSTVADELIKLKQPIPRPRLHNADGIYKEHLQCSFS